MSGHSRAYTPRRKHSPADAPEPSRPRLAPHRSAKRQAGRALSHALDERIDTAELPASATPTSHPAAEDGGARTRSAHALWSGALVRTFVAEKLGLPLGGGFAESTTFEDVLSWRPQTLLPYRDATTIATTGAAPAACSLRCWPSATRPTRSSTF